MKSLVKKLRRKFVITAMSALAVILVVLIAVINIANLVQATASSDQLLEILVEHDGTFPDVPPDESDTDAGAADSSAAAITEIDGEGGPKGAALPSPMPQGPGSIAVYREAEAPFTTRYFWVRLDPDGKVEDSDITHVAAISSAQAMSLAVSVASSGKEKGYAANVYRYRVKTEDEGGKLVVFKDCSGDIYNAQSLFRTSLLLMAVCLVLMFLLVWALAGRAVAPAVESMEKQKQFITDAGHELKTPLAVISADVDVLELENGKSEWTESIRKQCHRMTELVQNLLTLSRMDEEGSRIAFTEIDLSGILRETAEGFRTAAEAAGKSYSVSIQDGVFINGERNSMVQLLSVLIDNAVKYSDAAGNIEISMKRDRQVVIAVSNTCENIPEGNLNRLFDRFYRPDASRDRKSGGFGIGLSAARATAERHGGTISAERVGKHKICFRVILPHDGAPKAKRHA